MVRTEATLAVLPGEGEASGPVGLAARYHLSRRSWASSNLGLALLVGLVVVAAKALRVAAVVADMGVQVDARGGSSDCAVVRGSKFLSTSTILAPWFISCSMFNSTSFRA